MLGRGSVAECLPSVHETPGYVCFQKKKISRGAVKIAPWAKAMAAKSADLSEIPGNPMVEGEK